MNQQTIITALISISGTVALLFATKYVDAIFKAYPPDIKKHISTIKKLWAVIIRAIAFFISFILPVVSIVYLMYTTKVVDKWFVMGMILNTSALIVQLVLNISSRVRFELYFMDVLRKSEDEMRAIQNQRLDQIQNFSVTHVNRLIEINQKIIGLMHKIVENKNEYDQEQPR